MGGARESTQVVHTTVITSILGLGTHVRELAGGIAVLTGWQIHSGIQWVALRGSSAHFCIKMEVHMTGFAFIFRVAGNAIRKEVLG